MAKGYPPEFRPKGPGADRVRKNGRRRRSRLRRQRSDHLQLATPGPDRRGEVPGLRSPEVAELQAARRRIHELETELAATKRANELLRKVVPPKDRFATIAVMVEEGHPAQMSCRVLEVTDSGYYAWRSRRPSIRSVRHAWLTDLITQVHIEPRGTYGALRVHAELTMGRGVTVGHNAVAMLMHRAGLQGLPGARKRRSRHETPTAGDLVERSCTRAEPNQLWVTDITEHPTREGKVYCAVVLDTFSRRVVGWSIDSSPTASLVTSALGMAIDSRRPEPGALIHSDHGTAWSIHVVDVHRASEALRARPLHGLDR